MKDDGNIQIFNPTDVEPKVPGQGLKFTSRQISRGRSLHKDTQSLDSSGENGDGTAYLYDNNSEMDQNQNSR